jgi:hypothetical protein
MSGVPPIASAFGHCITTKGATSGHHCNAGNFFVCHQLFDHLVGDREQPPAKPPPSRLIDISRRLCRSDEQQLISRPCGGNPLRPTLATNRVMDGGFSCGLEPSDRGVCHEVANLSDCHRTDPRVARVRQRRDGGRHPHQASTRHVQVSQHRPAPRVAARSGATGTRYGYDGPSVDPAAPAFKP